MHIYGLIIGLITAGWYWFLTQDKKYGRLIEAYFWPAVIWLLFTSRLYHVLDNLDYYQNQPIKALYVWQGGLSIIGTLIGLAVFILWLADRYKLNWLDLANKIVVGLPLVQAIGRLGNWFNYEIVGRPIKTGFGWFIPEAQRPPSYGQYRYFHPVFFYEMVLDLFLFFYLKHKADRKSNLVTFDYLLLYGAIRFVLEYFRLPQDSFYLGWFNLNLIFFVFLMVVGLWGRWRFDKQSV